MKIAVFGSSEANTQVGRHIERPRAVEEFCRQFGSVVASSYYTLLVESEGTRTADRHIIEGLLASELSGQPVVRVYHRSHPRSKPFESEAKTIRNVFQFRPLPEKLLGAAHLRMLQDADVAIVVGGGGHAYSAGLAAAFMRVRLFPVASFGGAGGLLWEQLSDQFRKPLMRLPTQEIWTQLAGNPADALDAIQAELASLPRIMLVHGRSNDREEVVKILQENGVSHAIVLAERFVPGKTIPEKFEQEALQADGAIVLFTPDDYGTPLIDGRGEPLDPDKFILRARARQNVSIEYGWFWGRLGRERVIVLMKSELELPSDLSGIVYESYDESPRECEPRIRGFLDTIRRG